MDIDIENLRRETPQIIIDEAGKSYMLETARWAKFLAIMGLIAMSFIVLVVVVLMVSVPMLPAEFKQSYPGYSPGIMLFYLTLILIFFYPMYTLLKFANLVKVAVNNVNQQEFDDAFRYLKNTFRFWGIYTIILLFFYGIFIIFALTIAITSSI